MYIHNYAAFIGTPVEDMKYYKQEVGRYTRLGFRRANRFVLLAMAGAARCIHTMKIDTRTAVYLTTENGNLGDTEAVLDQIFHKREYPMPYNFINTMSNTASFYVAQSLALSGRNITLSSRQLSFERGLELLRCDMRRGVIDAALIGGVDEAVFSRQSFERCYPYSYDTYTMVEGSCWLLLHNSSQGARGRLQALESFVGLDAVLTWLNARPSADSLFLAFGILMDPAQRQAVEACLSHATVLDHIAEQGYFHSATAAAVTLFMQRCGDLDHGATLVHVNKDARGTFVVMVVESLKKE